MPVWRGVYGNKSNGRKAECKSKLETKKGGEVWPREA